MLNVLFTLANQTPFPYALHDSSETLHEQQQEIVVAGNLDRSTF